MKLENRSFKADFGIYNCPTENYIAASSQVAFHKSLTSLFYTGGNDAFIGTENTMGLHSLGNTFKWLAVGALCLVSGACAHIPQNGNNGENGAAVSDNDPLEPMNRGIYQFNYAFDTVLLRPTTQLYRFAIPESGRDMVSNFMGNLYTPVTFANSVLQLDPQNSFASLWRFIINSTFGLGGVFDVASEAGLKARTTDFGQTLGIYGAGPGPYIVLPIIGPSNGRDAIGRLADAFTNPFNYADEPWPYVMWGATAVDKRSENMKLLDDIYNTSLDPYATMRSAYTQKRASDIKRAGESREASLSKFRGE